MEMDEPSTSGKRVSVRDVAFVDRINMMLEDAQLSDGDSDVDDPVDDSDADPDYVLSEEEQHEDLADFDDSGDDSSTEEDPEHEVLLNDNSSLPKYIFGRLKKMRMAHHIRGVQKNLIEILVCVPLLTTFLGVGCQD